MNLQIHHVIADITGKSGTEIVEAILAGRRNPATLAELGDKRMRATKATLRAALIGNYRQEYLFCLRQAYAGYQFVMKQIAEVDTQLAAMLAALAAAPSPAVESGPAQTKPKPRPSASNRGQPTYDARGLIARTLGLDLTTIPGSTSSQRKPSGRNSART